MRTLATAPPLLLAQRPIHTLYQGYTAQRLPLYMVLPGSEPLATHRGSLAVSTLSQIATEQARPYNNQI